MSDNIEKPCNPALPSYIANESCTTKSICAFTMDNVTYYPMQNGTNGPGSDDASGDNWIQNDGRAVPCVKRYLGDRIVSQTVRIDADEWEVAIFLPVERFQKASKGEVWADSRRFY